MQKNEKIVCHAASQKNLLRESDDPSFSTLVKIVKSIFCYSYQKSFMIVNSIWNCGQLRMITSFHNPYLLTLEYENLDEIETVY